MSIKYKAILYETPQDADFLYISQIKKEAIDTLIANTDPSQVLDFM